MVETAGMLGPVSPPSPFCRQALPDRPAATFHLPLSFKFMRVARVLLPSQVAVSCTATAASVGKLIDASEEHHTKEVWLSEGPKKSILSTRLAILKGGQVDIRKMTAVSTGLMGRCNHYGCCTLVQLVWVSVVAKMSGVGTCSPQNVNLGKDLSRSDDNVFDF